MLGLCSRANSKAGKTVENCEEQTAAVMLSGSFLEMNL